MATSYRTPGVYVEEIAGGPRPIEAVGTSTAGFVGRAQNGANPNTPTSILNWLHYLRVFGGEGSTGPTTDLTCAVFGYFQNGGRMCYVVNVGDHNGPVPGAAGSREGVDALDLVDEVAIVAAPGYTDPTSYDRVLTHCENRKDRVAILDGPATFTDVNELTQVGTVAAPDTSRRSRRVAEESASGDADDGEAADAAPAEPLPAPATATGGYKARSSERGFGAQYGPWVVIADPLTGETIIAPPSGHIAGVWARTDAERGVHKAPANTILRGVTGFSQPITGAEQEMLNPVGFNVLRHFPDLGNVVWGARTVSDDPEWRYLNVRRLFSMIEESILRNTRWIVFEPNDKTLWESVRRDISAFLTRLWREGALFGRTPEEAFFVKCDEETNPPDVRDAGQVIAIVGIAPVKPAEFVIFKVSQHQAGSEIVEGAR